MLYKACMSKKRVLIKQCLPAIKAVCATKQIRVIKTVRLKLKTVAKLMASFPNLRVIHLFRNPKAVVMSRINAIWGSTLGSTDNQLEKDKLCKINKIMQKQLKNNITFDNLELEMIQKNGIIKEAKLFCKLLLEDINARKQIENDFPGSTYQLIYENLARSAQEQVQSLFSFLQEQIPGNVQSWMNGEDYAIDKWKWEMPIKISEQIDIVCKDVYKEIEF